MATGSMKTRLKVLVNIFWTLSSQILIHLGQFDAIEKGSVTTENYFHWSPTPFPIYPPPGREININAETGPG